MWIASMRFGLPYDGYGRWAPERGFCCLHQGLAGVMDRGTNYFTRRTVLYYINQFGQRLEFNFPQKIKKYFIQIGRKKIGWGMDR